MSDVCRYEDSRMTSNDLPQSSGTLKLNLSSANQLHQYEHPDPISQSGSPSQIGMFGDFCLMCGEMIDGEGFDGGSAYCSEQCEYHQHVMSDSDWCDLSMEGYQLPSYGGSTTVSSAKTTPLNSPHLQPSDRLAILCSGPPPCESLLPLDLNERLLGAKAVAERYLDHGTKSFEEEGDGEDDQKEDMTVQISPLDPADPVGSKNPLVQVNSKLKSRPALAQLTYLNHLTSLSELLGKKDNFTSPPSKSVSLVNLSSTNLEPFDHRHPTSASSKSSRRVSDSVFDQTESFQPSLTHHRRVCSSFSFSSSGAHSHVSLN